MNHCYDSQIASVNVVLFLFFLISYERCVSFKPIITPRGISVIHKLNSCWKMWRNFCVRQSEPHSHAAGSQKHRDDLYLVPVTPSWSRLGESDALYRLPNTRTPPTCELPIHVGQHGHRHHLLYSSIPTDVYASTITPGASLSQSSLHFTSHIISVVV